MEGRVQGPREILSGPKGGSYTGSPGKGVPEPKGGSSRTLGSAPSPWYVFPGSKGGSSRAHGQGSPSAPGKSFCRTHRKLVQGPRGELSRILWMEASSAQGPRKGSRQGPRESLPEPKGEGFSSAQGEAPPARWVV